MTKEKFWKIVDKLGWGTKSVDYEKLGMELLQHVSNKNEIMDMKTMAQDYRLALYCVIENFMDSEKKYTKYGFWGGDDSFWDFTAHIVGMGKEVYEKVLKDPKNMTIVGNDYNENFEYLFTEAMDYINTPEGKRILLMSKRNNKLKRLLKNKENYEN